MYATKEGVKAYLGISASTDDTLITALIARAQKWIEQRTGRVFEADSNTTHYLDAVADVDGALLLLRDDLCSINSITNGDGASVSSTYYVTEPRNETPYWAVRLKATSGLYWSYTTDPENAITVSGKWAYSTTPPANVQQACIQLAAYLYRQKDAAVFDTVAQPEMGVITIPQGIPRTVEMLLTPYQRKF